MSKQSYFSRATVQQLCLIQSVLQRLDPQGAPQASCIPGSIPPRGDCIIFPGSFNPPTTAHLALLKQAYHFAYDSQMMQLYAAFSVRTVDKENVERPLLLDRIQLLKQILQHRLSHAGILVFNRGLYVEQAQAIRSSFPAVRRLFFLMGFDKIVQILDPRYYQDRDTALVQLFTLAELLVAPRGDEDEDDLSTLLQQPQNERFARSIHALPLQAQYRHVSSTNIRRNPSRHEHDIPREARRFMRQTYAYAPPLQRSDGLIVDVYGERVLRLQEIMRCRGR